MTSAMTEPLQRATYSAPPEAHSPARPAPAREWLPTRRAGLAMLTGLGVLALAVVVVPRFWRTESKSPVAASTAPRAANPPATLLPEPPGAREAAQDALAALLTRLEALQARSVETWDADGLAKIEAARATGEAHYRAGLYGAAQREYAAAEAGIDASLAHLPEVVAEHLDAGERALRSGQPEAARRAFSAALALSPADATATRGLTRATHWDRVLALLAEAEGHMRLGDEARAVAAYEAALALDPDTREATLGLERIRKRTREVEFTAQMSAGYAAMARDDIRAAIRAFETALTLQPSASAPSQALAEARAAANAAAIARALARAASAEATEAWAEATRALEEALRLDPALAGSGLNLARARQRADLAKRLQAATRKLRADSATPVDAATRTTALKALADARRIREAGPRLRRELAQLEAALAARPVRVDFRSDGDTAVELAGITSLGRFNRRALALKPGRYTAVGRRRGFRDARVDFIVTAADAPPVVTVRCDDALPSGR